MLKINKVILIAVASFMGIKKSWEMLCGKVEIIEMFSKLGINRMGVACLGLLTLTGSHMIIFRKTFILGNLLMVSTILLIICFHFAVRDVRAGAIELPFFFLNLIILCLKYPKFSKPAL